MSSDLVTCRNALLGRHMAGCGVGDFQPHEQHVVTLVSVKDFQLVGRLAFDKIVIGASIRDVSHLHQDLIGHDTKGKHAQAYI